MTFMNVAFFTSVFVSVLVLEFLLPPTLYSDVYQRFVDVPFRDNFVLLFFYIFLNNLVLSAFVVVTLPGFVFFPLSAAFIVYRASVWGELLHFQTTFMFFAALPTLVLEGEAYVFAAVGGIMAGASWLFPKKVYDGEELARSEAFCKSLRECLRFYVFVVVLLLFAALVEAVTLTMIH